MMKKVVILFCLFFQCLVVPCRSSCVLEASRFDQIIGILKKTKPGTLVVLDVDNVSLKYTDKLLHPCGREAYRRHYAKLQESLYGQTISVGSRLIPLAEYLQSIMIQSLTSELIDPRLLGIIQELRGNGCDVIALTAGKIGPFGIFESMEDCRIEQLNKIGIDLNMGNFPQEAVKFEESVDGINPVFKQGVMLTAKSSKARCLDLLVKFLGARWGSVLVIDDRKSWVDEISTYEFTCGFSEITAVHYQDACFEETFTAENEAVTERQFEYLKRHHKWPSAADLL